MATKTKNHGDYTVGWICALPKEQTAATAMLDQRHGNLPKPPHDSNTYTLGSIGQHNVVIACLPKGKYGTNSAANVATLMIGTFPSIKVGLLVGIGGGIPPKVRLGDVVVSTPAGQFPGVVQWDMGKAKEGGKFERTGALNNPPNALLSALGKLETEHDLTGSKIPDYLNELKQKYPKASKNYLRSDTLQDLLFRAEYGHVSETRADEDAAVDDNAGRVEEKEEENDDNDDDEEEEEYCRFCDKSKIVKRKRRDMRVHYGLIASGNLVIKDAAFRDKLNKDLGGGVLCVEMEAAGLMNNFPCLVIRGICDYSDSHKNKAWQEHAAGVSAAFAKELLDCVQPSDVDGERQIKEVLNEVKQDLQRVHRRIEDGFNRTKDDLRNLLGENELKKQKDILYWLSQIDFAPQQNDYIARCERGTGQWLLKSKELNTWLATSKQTLFCPGIPGAGKTMQTCILVNDLVGRFEDDSTVGVAYLYCNFQRQQEQKAEYLLANLIKQLAQKLNSFPCSVQALHDRHQKRNTRPMLEELSTTLQSVVMSYSRVFILVDALDECHDTDGSRTKLLDHLFNTQSKAELNLFATSRFVPDIRQRFEGCPCTEIRPSREDIFNFLDKRMYQLPDFVVGDTGLQNEIKTEIESAIEGMFLLAQLYLDSLVGKRSPAALRTTLKGLRKASALSPDGSSALDEAYKKAMERIQRQRGDLPRDALLTFSWIFNARRQLRVPELQEALAVETGKSELDEDNIPTIEHITKACAPLIVVDRESNIVRLVHYTTQEYFERTQNIWFRNAQIDITKTCVTYLSFSAFESGFSPSQHEFNHRLESNNLYGYAARNWGHHAHEALTLGWEALEVIDFLECEMKREASSQVLMDTEFKYSAVSSPQAPRQVTALHLAGFFGLHNVVATLLTKGHDPNVKNTKGQTPLWWAARNGHAPVVKLLLEQNVDPDSKDNEYRRRPLSWAAINGHDQVVKLLLRKDVDLGPDDRSHLSPLAWAARNGQEAVVKLLLAKDTNLEIKDEVGLTPLAWAARNGHEGVVKLLLTKDSSLKVTDEVGLTPLAWAARNGHEAVVKLLLAKDTNPEVKDEVGLTPLAWAARNGHESVVKLLLAKDTNLEVKDEVGLTPLAWAVKNGHDVVAKLLLDSKANVNARDDTGTTILHWVAWRQDEAVMSLLLQHGAKTEIRNSGGGTALAAAVEKGSERIVKLLLANGASLNYRYPLYQFRASYESKDFPGRRAEYIVLEGYKWEDHQWFGERGRYYKKVKSSDGVDEWVSQREVSPLWRAAEKKDDKVMKLLQDKGAKLDFKNAYYGLDSSYTRFPLLWAAATGHTRIAKLLLERGDNANAKDALGETAIALAAKSGHEAIFSLLLASDKVDVDKKDISGSTPLSYAAKNGHQDILAVLLKSGKANPDSRDHDGRTPLSHAAEGGHPPAIELLIGSGKVDPDSKDNNGRTPLSYASSGRVSKLLVASGRVDIESRDKSGRTPLSHAAGDGCAEVVQLLLEHGADRNSKDEFGKMPLLWAREGLKAVKMGGIYAWGRRNQKSFRGVIKLLKLLHAVSRPRSPEYLSDSSNYIIFEEEEKAETEPEPEEEEEDEAEAEEEPEEEPEEKVEEEAEEWI